MTPDITCKCLDISGPDIVGNAGMVCPDIVCNVRTQVLTLG